MPSRGVREWGGPLMPRRDHSTADTLCSSFQMWGTGPWGGGGRQGQTDRSNRRPAEEAGNRQSHAIPGPMPRPDRPGGRAASNNRGKGASLPLFPSAILCPDTICGPTANKPGGPLKPIPGNCDSPRSMLRHWAGLRDANQMLTLTPKKEGVQVVGRLTPKLHSAVSPLTLDP